MLLLILVFLIGLCLGSFVNALVWRLHEQEALRKRKKVPASRLKALSIAKGRSMCPHCHHELAAKDLVPVVSWLVLRGKCRYCGKPISIQYPAVELATATLFIASYIWWPVAFNTTQTTLFVLWLALLVGLVALIIYDIRWLLLPNRIIYPLTVIALAFAIISVISANQPAKALLNEIASVAVGGGIFYLIFQISAGKWIGGGDVRLGWLLGLIVGTPGRSVLFIFIGSLLGSLVSLPLLAAHRLKRTSVVPFGPFLIASGIITVLFGAHILHWYQQNFLNF